MGTNALKKRDEPKEKGPQQKKPNDLEIQTVREPTEKTTSIKKKWGRSEKVSGGKITSAPAKLEKKKKKGKKRGGKPQNSLFCQESGLTQRGKKRSGTSSKKVLPDYAVNNESEKKRKVEGVEVSRPG